MPPSKVPSYPRVMPLAKAATDILGIDPHEGYRLAREGRIPGAFKVGKRVFVSTLNMIRGLQMDASSSDAEESAADDDEEFTGLLDGVRLDEDGD